MVEIHQPPSWQPKDGVLVPMDGSNHGKQQFIGVGDVDIGGDVLVTSWRNSVPSPLVIGDIAV